MLIAVISGFLFALSLLIFGKFIKTKGRILPALLPISLFIYFCQFIPTIYKGEVIRQTFHWVPSFGLNLNFVLDGVSLIFSLMITFIGSLVFIYTSGYLKGHPYLDRFYSYLSIFMGAMLGVVLSDNILAMFLFWEMTSISSFFLIGFNNDKADSRRSAIIALSVTGIGGLFLFAGMVLLAKVTSSYSLQEIMTMRDMVQNSIYYLPIVLLVFGAAFTKSAQFPFHFWLPGAMKAPTPVSTYLHSATMVKAGIYLLIRMTPVLGGQEIWNTTLITIGGITMLYAAMHTLFRTDLKGILAYSTISALGILTFLIGIGTRDALLAALVFILVHATYKSTLFLVTGIIDHETGTRDITKLAGLRKVMMPVAIAGLLAGFSNAGFPPFFGFLGKDLIYETTLHTEAPVLLTAIAVITNLLLLYAGFVAGWSPFKGKLPEEYKKIHLPPVTMWLPPLLMGTLCIIFGLFPSIIEGTLMKPSVNVLGFSSDFHLKLWHGFSIIIILSAVTIIGGALLYFFMKPTWSKENFIQKFEKISPESITIGITNLFNKLSIALTIFFQNGFLRRYVVSITIFAILVLGISIFSVPISYILDLDLLYDLTFYEIVVVLVMFIGIFFAVFSKSRLVAISALGLMGFSFCMIFMIYSAPDLAMTQFSIDTLTVILFVLVLYKLPKYLTLFDYGKRLFHGIVSLLFGVIITLIALETLAVPPNTEVSDFYAKNSYVMAHGKNIVNVILVDFRGADTMMEITVLSIAALGVFALIKLRLKTRERFKA